MTANLEGDLKIDWKPRWLTAMTLNVFLNQIKLLISVNKVTF